MERQRGRDLHAIRYDDLSAVSTSAVDELLVQTLLDHRIPCTFAVIPFVADSDELLRGGSIRLRGVGRREADLLRPLLEAGLAEIALHGYAHLALAPLRQFAEFSDGMPVETQRGLIRRGRGHLEDTFGVRVGLFVPPWNRLASSTATILAEEDLELSGDLRERAPARMEALRQAHCMASISTSSKALMLAQRLGRATQPAFVGTLVHDYDFAESGFNVGYLQLAEFEAMLSQWRSRFPDAVPCTVSEAIASESAHGDRHRANVLLQRRFAASRVGRRLLRGMNEVYWSTETASRLATWLAVIP